MANSPAPAGSPRAAGNAGSAKYGSPAKSPRGSTARELAGEEGDREEVKVVVRVRPPIEHGRPLVYFVDEGDQTKLLSTTGDACSSTAPASTARSISVEEFGFSRVLGPREDNRRTFDSLGLRDLIGGVVRGYQETIFAYGQTGSGKTHTILGSAGGEPGLLQLCTVELFNRFAASTEAKRYIQLACLEIKNEEVVDLLPERVPGVESRCDDFVTFLEPYVQETISVKGKRTSYRKVAVWSFDEAMWLLRGAVASREVGSSTVNSESSRSHMVVRFTVKSFNAPVANAGATGIVGSLTLVDLAGNERESPYDTGVGSAARKEEAKAINVSLTHLNRMLVKMQNGQLDESDRRQCTLNMVLYESLVEDCGVTMVFCIHPDRRYALSARSTLQMALRCRRIVRKKRIRCIEAGKYVSELADLRSEANALTRAHREAREAQQRKEEELKETASRLDDLRLRYEEKSKDYESLRASLEVQYHRLTQEDMEKQRLVQDLGRKNELLNGLIEQLQERDNAYADLQRRFEEACSGMGQQRSRKAVDDCPSMAGAGAGEAAAVAAAAAAVRCQELEKAHQDELRAVRADYEKQLRSLQDALHQSQVAATAASSERSGGSSSSTSRKAASTAGDATPSSAARALGASPPQSVREPCSEPSMHSSRAELVLDDAGGCGSSGGVSTVCSVGSGLADLQQGASFDAFPRTPMVHACLVAEHDMRQAIKQVASPLHAGSRVPVAAFDPGGEPLPHLSIEVPLAPAEAWHPNNSSMMAGVAAAAATAAAVAADASAAAGAMRGRYASGEGGGGLGAGAGGGAAALDRRGLVAEKSSGDHRELRPSRPKGERAVMQLETLLGAGTRTLGSEAAAVASAESTLAQLCRSALQGRVEPSLRPRCANLVIESLRRFPSSMRVLRDGAKALAELGNKDTGLTEAIVGDGALALVIKALWDIVAAVEPVEGPDAAGGGGAGTAAEGGGAAAQPVHDESRISSIGGHTSSILPDVPLTSEACSSAFRLLAVLSQRHRGNQAAVREGGGIDAVLRLLAAPAFKHSEEAAVHGCWLLMALCHKHRENQDTVRLRGGPAMLLGLLSREVASLQGASSFRHARSLDETRVVTPASATLCAYIAGCIASVTESNAGCQQAFFEAGGVRVLLRTLETCLQSPHVVTNACIAIAHLAYRHEACQDETRLRGGMQAILGALLAYRGHRTVQGGICRAIAVLAESTANQMAFLQARLPDGDSEATAVALLLQALDVPEQDETLATTACWALANLAVGSADAMKKVRQLRGLEIAVSLLDRFAHEERPCEYLCRLIAGLSRGDATLGVPATEAVRLGEAARRNRQELQTLGAREAISAVAENHARSQGFVLVHARDALQLLRDEA